MYGRLEPFARIDVSAANDVARELDARRVSARLQLFSGLSTSFIRLRGIMLSQAFTRKKRAIIDQLNAPDDRYQDASPKGTVDEGVRTLLDQINDIESLVSTSSCAGRVSVFVGGRGKSKSGVSYGDGHQSTADNKTQDSFQSGKGGGKWTFVSHEPVILPDETQGSDHHFHDLFNMISSSEKKPLSINDFPLMHFKFEPMVCHLIDP